jgi:hypothetical protein
MGIHHLSLMEMRVCWVLGERISVSIRLYNSSFERRKRGLTEAVRNHMSELLDRQVDEDENGILSYGGLSYYLVVCIIVILTLQNILSR